MCIRDRPLRTLSKMPACAAGILLPKTKPHTSAAAIHFLFFITHTSSNTYYIRQAALKALQGFCKITTKKYAMQYSPSFILQYQLIIPAFVVACNIVDILNLLKHMQLLQHNVTHSNDNIYLAKQ